MEEIKNFKDKKVLIVGMGLSGVAAARLLSDFNADVRITDSRDELELVENIMQLPDGVTIETGRHSSMVDGIDMVVVSPGVSTDNPIITKAYEHNIPVISEIELAYSFTASIPWIAVTGTNGKSTTTTLIDLILRSAGYNIITGGNLGMPLCGAIKDHYSSNSKERVDYIVSEISSFQLETIETFRPHISVILNITPDHLDRYRDMDEYIGAKKRILKNLTEEDKLILNFDDPVIKVFEKETRARTYFFSMRPSYDGISAFLKDGSVYINGEKLIAVNDMVLRGVHNIENAMAAALASMLAGASLKPIRDVLISFRGIEHRLEYVDRIESVEFYNDSKGTNIGAVIKSLESFEHSVVLILGGKDKGSDFKDLIPYIKGRIKAVVAMGECKEKVVKQLKDEVLVVKAEDMRDTVDKAFELAKPSGIVLLSPGCASFDMFENFEHRGRVFKEEIYRIRGR